MSEVEIQILAFARLSEADREACRRFATTTKDAPSRARLEVDGETLRPIFECRPLTPVIATFGSKCHYGRRKPMIEVGFLANGTGYPGHSKMPMQSKADERVRQQVSGSRDETAEVPDARMLHCAQFSDNASRAVADEDCRGILRPWTEATSCNTAPSSPGKLDRLRFLQSFRCRSTVQE